MSQPASARPTLTPVQWLICAVAALGFLFDTYELLMLPLVGPPAIEQMGGFRRGSPEFLNWVGLLFYVPAVFGGIFGLLGGYLTDRFGRQRVLVWSILIYAFSALGAGLFATSLPVLLVLRTTTFIGVCVEFVAAVAWLAELFDDPKQREVVLGWTQAFGSLGGLLVSHFFTTVAENANSLPAIHGGHEPWRYTLISGVIPAVPLIIVRAIGVLPESAAWAAKKAAGTLRRPSLGELFTPQYMRTTVVCTVMMACVFGVAFGSIQQISQIVPGFKEVAGLPRPRQQPVIGDVQRLQEIGGLVGRILLAILAVYVARRRTLLWLFQIPSLVLIPVIFGVLGRGDLATFKWGVFLAGLLTVSQISFWGNYLPRVYPVHLRGTGESFAANIGGRLVGTMGALVTTQIAKGMGEGPPPVVAGHVAQAASLVGAACCIIGFTASFFLPEPGAEELPD